MTAAEINIAIAESLGRGEWWCPQCKKTVSEYSLGYQARHANCSESAQQRPHYCTDLNAMAEAEMLLDDHAWTVPGTIIKGSLGLYDVYASHLSDRFGRSIRATARQRAEAFLRTIGKWKEPTT